MEMTGTITYPSYSDQFHSSSL